MITLLKRWFTKPVIEKQVKKKKTKRVGFFSPEFTSHNYPTISQQARDSAYKMTFQKDPLAVKTDHVANSVAMDASVKSAMDGFSTIKPQFSVNTTIPDNQILWYGSQSFIGFPVCAMMAQHWLVNKACLMPAKDAVRNGYEITANDGEEIEPKLLDQIRKADVRYKLNKNLIEFIQMGRVFGIRIVMFWVDVPNPKDFYFKPFNIDGIPKNSYRGMSQIDPYWITPQLDNEAAGNPGSIDFYEPTWWRINDLLVHRTHLIIFRTEELPDILKPTYIYAGVSIPQKIYERVYAAERTANEAPLLTLTKRTDVLKTDSSQALAQQDTFFAKMMQWRFNRDNYGIKVIDNQTEDMMQFDTTLTDLDAVIMTQYQLVAAIANVPATKLLGTQPKGFNSSGEYEEASYHEELESLQYCDLAPLIERHHQILIKSDISPDNPFETSISWNPLDAMTAKELAEVNKLKADAGQVLMSTGAIDGEDERNRIINDPESGYNGMEAGAPEPEIESDPNEEE